jgi:hypothetical protein
MTSTDDSKEIGNQLSETDIFKANLQRLQTAAQEVWQSTEDPSTYVGPNTAAGRVIAVFSVDTDAGTPAFRLAITNPTRRMARCVSDIAKLADSIAKIELQGFDPNDSPFSNGNVLIVLSTIHADEDAVLGVLSHEQFAEFIEVSGLAENESPKKSLGGRVLGWLDRMLVVPEEYGGEIPPYRYM